MKNLILSSAALFALSFTLTACSGLNKNSAREAKSAKDTTVSLQTREMAMARSAQVHGTSYDLTVELNESSPHYTGEMKIDFQLKAMEANQKREGSNKLWVDFRGGEILHLTINDQPVGHVEREGSLTWLPSSLLKAGPNTITVKFKQQFNTNGVGLHRFKDPVDGRVYLYTHFEPYDASRFAPLFDQPDMRATLKMKVKAPRKWTVITATEPQKVSNAEKDFKLWDFKKTAPVATYLYSLHAGPYKMYKSTYAGRVPMRLFARRSLARYVPVKDWFKWSQQGFQYFEKYFGVKYPFKKYDQVIVPEFNMGAMENVAAITFSERYIKRGGMTYNERQRLASVILHEMAHQWFGNLVTMKWWDNLWLNESFATFMAAKAMSAATEFDDAWIDFNSEKQWAMHEDQLVTTHPIAATVENTDQAFNNFDGITYGKGGAVLQQLDYLLGEKSFQKGIKYYFKKHAYQNTVLQDFISALQTESKLDLQNWSQLWLEQSGVDSIQAKAQCGGENEKLQSVTLTVDKSKGAKFRPQSVEVANLILAKGNELKVHSSQKVHLANETTTVEWKREAPCPALVFANYQDRAYFKTPLTTAGVKILKKNLSSVDDTHLRLMLWTTLWQMVTDKTLHPAQYAEVVLNNIGQEKDMKIYSQVLQNLVGGGSQEYYNAIYFLPEATDGDKARKNEIVARTEGLLLTNLAKSKRSSDKQKATLSALSAVAQSERALNELYILAQDEKRLDVDRRWRILQRLCGQNHPKALELKGQLLQADPSSRGQSSALACEAARPDLTRKKELFAQVTNPSSALSGEQKKAIIRALFDDSREEFLRGLEEEIKSYVKAGLSERDEDFQDDFASALAPVTCDKSDLDEFRKFIDKANLTDVTKRAFEVTLDLRTLCVQLRSMGPAHSRAAAL